MEETKNKYKILDGKTENKRPVGVTGKNKKIILFCTLRNQV
jgi:hypothetical protein